MKRKTFTIEVRNFETGTLISEAKAHAFNAAKNNHALRLIRAIGGVWNRIAFDTAKRDGFNRSDCVMIWQREGDDKKITVEIHQVS